MKEKNDTWCGEVQEHAQKKSKEERKAKNISIYLPQCV